MSERIKNAKIDRAGKKIRKSDNLLEVSDSVALVNRWRSDHVFVIGIFQNTLKRYAKEIDKKAILAQRLKKIDSIALKLKMIPTMALSKMQDIGGCRVIFINIEDVYKLVEKYKHSRIRHKLVKPYDYIEKPKDSGYRGYHLVYEYYSTRNDRYNGYFVEIQIRTMLQHIWSTTVETAGAFTKNSFKSSIGDPEWLEFFKITSRLIEFYEMNKHDKDEKNRLIERLEFLENNYKFLAQISAFTVSAENVINKEAIRKNERQYYLLMLNYETRRLSVRRYSNKEIDTAQNDYAEYEKNEKFNAVLVAGDDIKQLKKAYPNYFTNTKKFLEIITKIKEDN